MASVGVFFYCYFLFFLLVGADGTTSSVEVFEGSRCRYIVFAL